MIGSVTKIGEFVHEDQYSRFHKTKLGAEMGTQPLYGSLGSMADMLKDFYGPIMKDFFNEENPLLKKIK